MLINDMEYMKLLDNVLKCIKTSQYKVVLGANLALLHRNWVIGNYINANNTWGRGFLKNLSNDIKANFPDVSGFSERNLRDMKKFAIIFDEDDIDIWTCWSYMVSS